MKRRINPAIELIPAIHRSGIDRVWFHRLRHANDRVTSLIDAGPGFRANPCQNRGTIRGTFFCHYGFYFVPIYVGLNLPPEC